MIAFFDTSVHINLLSGVITLEVVNRDIGSMPVRLSPVVGSELLRGVSRSGRTFVERLVNQLVSVEPPSWRQCWYDAGRLLPQIFPHHEEIGISRLQNDLLLALTARHTGALFVTHDGHFETIRSYIPFRFKKI